MIKTLTKVFAMVLVATTLCGCAAQRWTISNARHSYSREVDPGRNYDASITVLLDNKTGESWALLPAEEAEKPGYSWYVLPRAE